MATPSKPSRAPARTGDEALPLGPDGRPLWLSPEGEPVSCTEKVAVLNENLDEIREACQEALEDAVLMGCDEAHARRVLHAMVDALHNPYRK